MTRVRKWAMPRGWHKATWSRWGWANGPLKLTHRILNCHPQRQNPSTHSQLINGTALASTMIKISISKFILSWPLIYNYVQRLSQHRADNSQGISITVLLCFNVCHLEYVSVFVSLWSGIRISHKIFITDYHNKCVNCTNYYTVGQVQLIS